MIWYDYLLIYVVANILHTHLKVMFVPGGFIIGLTGILIFYQLFELYCKWRSGKWNV